MLVAIGDNKYCKNYILCYTAWLRQCLIKMIINHPAPVFYFMHIFHHTNHNKFMIIHNLRTYFRLSVAIVHRIDWIKIFRQNIFPPSIPSKKSRTNDSFVGFETLHSLECHNIPCDNINIIDRDIFVYIS